MMTTMMTVRSVVAANSNASLGRHLFPLIYFCFVAFYFHAVRKKKTRKIISKVSVEVEIAVIFFYSDRIRPADEGRGD